MNDPQSDFNEKSSKIGKIVVDETNRNKSKNIIKICSYNLLAPDLLESNLNLYMHINRLYLDWNYRKKLLLNQFSRLKADVISSFFKQY